MEAGLIVAIALFIFVAITIAKGVRIVPQGQEWIVERLGKYLTTLKPGLNIVIPYLDKVAYELVTKDIILDVQEQEVITRDNAVILTNAIAFIKVTDPVKAVYGVTDFSEAIRNLIMTTLRSIVGEMELDEALSSRDKIKARLRESIADEAVDWGLTVKSVEIQDIKPSPSMQKAMELQAAAERIGQVRLIVVDPIVSAVMGDSHKNTEVRRALQPLVDLAASMNAALVGITHFSKGGQGIDPAQRVLGSVAFTAVARVVLVAAKVQSTDGEDRRILARGKSNIGPDDGGVTYSLEQCEPLPGIQASRVSWGAAVQGSARELLTDPSEQDGDGESSRTEAADFLREVLADGPVPSKEVQRQAREAGVPWITVRRAGDDLMVLKRKGGMTDGWYWSLPKMLTTAPKNAEGAHGKERATSSKFEQLREGVEGSEHE